MAALAPHRRHGWLIASVLLAVALNPLNSATISVGLALVLASLHAGAAGITWIVSGYYLGSAVAQPIMGSLGDRMGYRRLVYSGFLLILVTAVLAPLSHSLWVFVGWRVVQAVGTSMVFPNAVGLVRRWEAGRVPVILGWIGMSAGIALAVGPALGGLLIAAFGWQSIFWLNIPIAVAAGLLMQWGVPDDRPAAVAHRAHWDWPGSLFFTAAMVGFLLYATSPAPKIYMLAAALAALGFLILCERRAAAPIIPLDWFSSLPFATASLATVVTNLVMYVALYGVPFLLETREHVSVTQSGLMLLIFAGVLALGSPLGGRLARGEHRRAPYLASAVILIAGITTFWTSSGANLWLVGIALGLMGTSFAISNVLLQQMVLESRPTAQSGGASGVFSLMRYVGTMASSVVVARTLSVSGGLSPFFVCLAAAGVLSGFLAVGIPRTRRVYEAPSAGTSNPAGVK